MQGQIFPHVKGNYRHKMHKGDLECAVYYKLGKVAIANALQLEGCPTLWQSFWAVLANFVLCMRTNWYFQAFDQILTSLLDSVSPIL